ncbi:penicillin-binding protein 2 [Porticoccaceae bacterium]|jgi:penicillin-binding protein 2|nr:penicillin-binding protein 2 [Porticoccaceae bacterium]MDA7589219.1 penicillin-binding protein 2 [Porticoccaceae bacterium]MDA9592607.1 penicillin-binding protein 2 [Porticoccaceae bacterium]MDB2566435.1 penicillin-binding protein 2 [Porticoccaceae bacterium]MDB2621461.1 penicillin-binding protein 2 [Porticoccaceae bacterium]
MQHEAAFSDPTRERNIFVGRIVIASFFVLAMALVLLARYADLQVTQHQDFVTNSDNNRVHIRPVPPARGVIYDRNGEILADNRPASNLTIIRERTKDLNSLITKIGSLIQLSDADIKRFYKRLERRRPFEQTPLKFNLSAEEQAILAVNEYLLEGIKVSARLTRSYPKGELFAHVVGYVGRINERELRAIDSIKYSGTDSIGKVGLEKFYEQNLLGEVGSEHVETNAKGRVMRVLDQADPNAGNDLVLHLDSRLQQISYDAFDGERGALIAMDIKNGGILAMVSAPSYDPNLFVSGISQKNYDLLVNSTDKPLFNRAIRGQYPPGSTVKPLFGLIGLTNKNITIDTKIEDPGYFIMEGIERPWRDHNSKRGGHGSDVDLAEAIIESCDVFFYKMGIKTGIDALSSQSAMFGLGTKTGIDLPGEASGIMPTRKWKKESRNAAWYNGDTINMSIGQGFMLTTPLQLAVMASRIASKGNIVQPQIVKSINNKVQPTIFLPSDSKIDEENWTYVHGAMKDVVHSSRGTAKSISSGLLYQIAGKTGTAQVVSINADEDYDKSKLNKRQWDHALFIAFAPAENPEVAIGLIVENGEHGSSVAAPIARKVLDAYMSNREDNGKELISNSSAVKTGQGYLAYAE